MKKFPRLYKKNSNQGIQFWEISVEEAGFCDNEPYSMGEIITKYGKLDTDSPQYTKDIIREGKNIGKKNATTAFQQAVAEAQSKWEKKKKTGYVESIDDAQDDKLDALIEGGVEPMLAQSFSKQGHKIKYPCIVQPKLDGIRCVAIIKDGACTLWSRTRKPIKSVPHIVQELEAAFENRDIILDGELYNHDFKTNFEHIVHLVRQEEPDPQHTDVQYHIYDTIDSSTNDIRAETIDILFAAYEFVSLKQVETEEVETEEQVMEFFAKFKAMGYEGAMLRNYDGKYVNKRSYDLQKVKEFDGAEFSIIGVEEGRGKLAGHVGSFVCITPSGKKFLAKMAGDTEKLREYFTNHSLWKDKKLTVQYQGLTGKENVPRFPVGVAIRDYE